MIDYMDGKSERVKSDVSFNEDQASEDGIMHTNQMKKRPTFNSAIENALNEEKKRNDEEKIEFGEEKIDNSEEKAD